MKYKIFLILFSLLHFAKAQQLLNKDSILLLNGKVISCDITSTDKFITQYNITKKNGKLKSSYSDNLNVFSLRYAQKKDTILYFQDTIIGNELSINEMRNFVYGAQDARNNYKTYWIFTGGAVLGFSSVFLDTYLYPKEASANGVKSGPFKSSPSVLPIVVPFVYTLSVGLPKTRLRSKHVTYYDLKNEEFYQRGFEKIARQKRIFAALESTLSGMAFGYICYFAFRP